MGTVRLEFSPQPAHVRTARLVGVAVARRAGLPEDRLDEVRLAIGEACGRAVTRHRRHGVHSPIVVEMSDESPYTVLVTDQAPADPAGSLAGVAEDDVTVEASLALLAGLVEELRVTQGEGGQGSVVRMAWQSRRSSRSPGR